MWCVKVLSVTFRKSLKKEGLHPPPLFLLGTAQDADRIARVLSSASWMSAIKGWKISKIRGVWGPDTELLHPGFLFVCVHAKSLQSCPTLCDPMDCSLPGSSSHGILQARILEWVAMPFSRASFQPRDGSCIFPVCWKWKSLSRVWLFATPWTLQSKEFSRPEYWSG